MSLVEKLRLKNDSQEVQYVSPVLERAYVAAFTQIVLNVNYRFVDKPQDSLELVYEDLVLTLDRDAKIERPSYFIYFRDKNNFDQEPIVDISLPIAPYFNEEDLKIRSDRSTTDYFLIAKIIKYAK